MKETQIKDPLRIKKAVTFMLAVGEEEEGYQGGEDIVEVEQS